MESQPKNPEFRIDPENFHTCIYEKIKVYNFKNPELEKFKSKNWLSTIFHSCHNVQLSYYTVLWQATLKGFARTECMHTFLCIWQPLYLNQL